MKNKKTDKSDPRITSRKKDHIDISIKKNVNSSVNYWDYVRLVHEAIPRQDLHDVDTSTRFLGKKLKAPLIVTAITGGYKEAEKINRNLAAACASRGIGLGLGSQRASLKNPRFKKSYTVITNYDVPLVIGNIGAPQLIAQGKEKPLTDSDINTLIDMIDADILAVHLNYLQECIQTEGDRSAKNIRDRIGKLCRKFPVMIKETGAGISTDVALFSKKAGVKAIDISGVSGTSFAAVEYHRAVKKRDNANARMGELFWDWGIPSPISVLLSDVDLPMVASGGVRNGLDIARALALGANVGGMARRLLPSAMKSQAAVEKEIDHIVKELKTAMFLCGAVDVKEARRINAILTGELLPWAQQLMYYDEDDD